MTKAIKHRGFKITHETKNFCIYYPNGIRSNLTPSSIEWAKMRIDEHIKELIRVRNFKRTA